MPPGERVYLLADMHLKPLDAPGAAARELAARENERLAAFLSEIDGRAGQLILLGDAFNFWFERYSRVAGDYSIALRLFKAAADRGLEIHHVSGNRDYAVGEGLGFDPLSRHPGFLRLGKGFTVSRLTDFGIEPHGGRHRLRQAGQNILCLHGDSLCTGDRLFMALRWLLQGPVGRLVMHYAPWRLIEPAVSLAQGRTAVRTLSRRAGDLLAPDAAARELARGADLLLCGHIHARLTLEIEVLGRKCRLEAIPAWLDGWFGVLEDGGVRVEKFA